MHFIALFRVVFFPGVERISATVRNIPEDAGKLLLESLLQRPHPPIVNDAVPNAPLALRSFTLRMREASYEM